MYIQAKVCMARRINSAVLGEEATVISLTPDDCCFVQDRKIAFDTRSDFITTCLNVKIFVSMKVSDPLSILPIFERLTTKTM